MPKSKKSFKDNPALAFIEGEEIIETEIEEQNTEQDANQDANQDAKIRKIKIEGESKEVHIPKGYKINPLFIETKSRRLQLLMQPGLHAKLKDRADKEKRSLNDLIHSILEDAVGD